MQAAQNRGISPQERSTPTAKMQPGRSPAASQEKQSPLDILTDTTGVDFQPFLHEAIHKIRTHWYELIPEAAKAPSMKKGGVTIGFRVMEDGRIEDSKIYESSGDASLDEAARQAVVASNPLSALPADFACNYADLRFHFYYNPDTSDKTTRSYTEVQPCVTSTIRMDGVVGLEVSPNSVKTSTKGKQQFVTKTAIHSSEAVRWSIAGRGCAATACGTISAEGLFTAPDDVPDPPTVTVTATLKTTPPETASATLTIVRSATSH
jgi:TonB family protein